MHLFRNWIYRFYHQNGRIFPWRETTDPYKILVSELMLQQTQTERVVPKYEAFLLKFPTVQVLAKSELGEVLLLWQGLGYNRRAKFLHLLAKRVVNEFGGNIPNTQAELLSLPGVGQYTMSAILAFAFNKPGIVIETNIRTVFLYHFFPGAAPKTIHDSDILTLIEQSLDTQNPREWYYALMDYGAFLKKVVPNPSRYSKHHVKQSQFKGSLRQVRGAILRAIGLFPSRSSTISALENSLDINTTHIQFQQAIQQLAQEELITISRDFVSLPK